MDAWNSESSISSKIKLLQGFLSVSFMGSIEIYIEKT